MERTRYERAFWRHGCRPRNSGLGPAPGAGATSLSMASRWPWPARKKGDDRSWRMHMAMLTLNYVAKNVRISPLDIGGSAFPPGTSAGPTVGIDRGAFDPGGRPPQTPLFWCWRFCLPFNAAIFDMLRSWKSIRPCPACPYRTESIQNLPQVFPLVLAYPAKAGGMLPAGRVGGRPSGPRGRLRP